MPSRPTAGRILGASLIAGALAVLACGGDGARPSARVGDSALQATEAGAAPEFSLVSLEGDAVRLSDSDGQVRLLDFWATWCAPCRDEIPLLNELQASFGPRGLKILAISDEDRGVLQEFVERYGVRYTNLIGTAEVHEDYGVLGLPTAFLVDGEGRIVERFLGPKPRKVLEARITELLGGQPST